MIPQTESLCITPSCLHLLVGYKIVIIPDEKEVLLSFFLATEQRIDCRLRSEKRLTMLISGALQSFLESYLEPFLKTLKKRMDIRERFKNVQAMKVLGVQEHLECAKHFRRFIVTME